MKKILLLAVLAAGIAVIYSVLNDPVKKERVLGTIESSTGVNLNAAPQEVLEDTGRAVGSAADRLLRDLGGTLTDPEFHRSLERWGRDALDRLDEADLGKLRRELEKVSDTPGADYDAILEKYLGEAMNS